MITVARDYHWYEVFNMNNSSPYTFTFEIKITLENIYTYNYINFIYA